MTQSLPSIFNRQHLADPYPTYHRLREADPVHWDESIAGGGWAVTRYADVLAGLRDSRLSGNRMPMYRLFLPDTADSRSFDADLSRSLFFLDPPQHTKLRGIVAKAFTPRMIEGLRPRIQAISDELLDAAAAKGEIELIHDFATPLPVMVIAELIGVPLKDRQQLKQWSAALTRFALEIRGVKRAIAAYGEFSAYLRTLLAERRTNPGSELLSALLFAEEQGEQLSEADIIATCIMLLTAGHETTTNLIGNGLLALLRNPAELALLREKPDLVPAAVEELLRYDGPIVVVTRVASADLELGGQKIAQGQIVVLGTAAANHDPAQFPDPDRLDLQRKDVRHLAFGMGIHYCLGASLARLESAIAFTSLLKRWPGLRLTTDQLEWQDHLSLRGLRALPLSFI